MSKMIIYAAGGAAINIASSMAKYTNSKEYGFSEIETYFIDTSSSNIHDDIPEDKCYMVEGLDGSGKVRKSNYAVLSECSKEILHKFKPDDINIVLHSSSGGTGSTLGPIIVSELLSRGLNVIVLTVGSSSSRIETENTMKTLKSYEMIARKTDKPVCMYYKENSVETPRSAVDSSISTALVVLATLFSSDNKELDLSDLTNFLNYNSVTSYGAQLALLELYEKDVVLDKGHTIISAATLIDNTSSPDLEHPIEYQCVGYLPEKIKDIINLDLPIHVTVMAGHFNKTVDRLNKLLSEYDEARKVVVSKSIIDNNDDSTSEGLIL